MGARPVFGHGKIGKKVPAVYLLTDRVPPVASGDKEKQDRPGLSLQRSCLR